MLNQQETKLSFLFWASLLFGAHKTKFQKFSYLKFFHFKYTSRVEFFLRKVGSDEELPYKILRETSFFLENW